MTRGLRFQCGRLCLRVSTSLFVLLVSTVASAGVGIWTTNGPPNPNPDLSRGGVVLDPQTPGTIYAGGARGLSKSTDNGQTWSSVILSGQPARPLAAGPAGTVYAGVITVIELLPPLFSTDVYKSTDGGSDWHLLFQSFNADIGLTIDPETPTTLYRVSNLNLWDLHFPVVRGGLHRSTDGGVTWTEIDQGLDGNAITALVVDPKTPGTLYVASAPEGRPISPLPAAAIRKSTDAGATWTLLTNTLGAISSLVQNPFVPTTVYAAGTGGVFKSTDGGNTFLSINSTLNAFSTSSELVIDPRHPSRLFVGTLGGLGVFVSIDDSATWTPINDGLTGSSLYVTALVIDSTGTYLHAATEALGVFDYQITDPGLLFLNAAHSFTITLSATDQRTGRTGPGVATQMNDIFGYFSIPAITGNPSNPEVFVKVLNGTGVNGRYWFFYGGLTDLEYTLNVTEDATGLTKSYTKAAGSACGGFDTEAFTP